MHFVVEGAIFDFKIQLGISDFLLPQNCMSVGYYFIQHANAKKIFYIAIYGVLIYPYSSFGSVV
jgi:hypothetical protein